MVSAAVEAAWQALWEQHEDAADYCGFNRAAFDKHRAAIEAAGPSVAEVAEAALARERVDTRHLTVASIIETYARRWVDLNVEAYGTRREADVREVMEERDMLLAWWATQELTPFDTTAIEACVAFVEDRAATAVDMGNASDARDWLTRVGTPRYGESQPDVTLITDGDKVVAATADTREGAMALMDAQLVRMFREPIGFPGDEPTDTQKAEHERHSALGENHWVTCPLCDDASGEAE